MEGIQLGGMNGLNVRLTNVRRVEICLFLVKSSSSFDVKQVYQTTYLSEDPRPIQRRMILLLMLKDSKQYFAWYIPSGTQKRHGSMDERIMGRNRVY